jgi:5-formyltetrahydrofolate cyclo-ligase
MKHQIRQELREKRKALTPDLYAKKSKAIREKLENLPQFKDAKKVMAYVSTEEEVDTRDLIKDCFAKGQTVYIPKVDRNELKIIAVKKWEVLEPGTFSILEPMMNSAEEANPEDLDLILVPGIAFDKRGHRLGHGHGFYDRTLKKTRAFKVGLAFDEQIVDEIPNEEHDVPVDLIITDSSLITPNP